MPVREVPRAILNLSWELNPGRLEDHARRAFSSLDQREVGTNAYSALMMGLHWLEISELGSKTTSHSERVDTELRAILSRLSQAGIVDERAQTEAWILLYYWIVGYWGEDPGSAHLLAVQRTLARFLSRFPDMIGRSESLPRLLGDRMASAPPSDDELFRLLDEVRRLYRELDVGEW